MPDAPRAVTLRHEGCCWICADVLLPGHHVYATGRGGSQRLYCSARCADPRPCATCRHPQRQHDRAGCFGPVVDRYGNEDACGCRTPRKETTDA